MARFNKVSHYQKLSVLWLLAGSALFAFLVYRTGVRAIVFKLEVFGVYFLLLLLISGLRQVLRTFAWRYCIEREHRQVSLLELFKLRRWFINQKPMVTGSARARMPAIVAARI